LTNGKLSHFRELEGVLRERGEEGHLHERGSVYFSFLYTLTGVKRLLRGHQWGNCGWSSWKKEGGTFGL